VERIFENNTNQYYGLFSRGDFSDLDYFIGRTNSVTEWTEDLDSAFMVFYDNREEDWTALPEYVRLNLLENNSLLLSALFFSWSNEPYVEFLQSLDGKQWYAGISTNNWSHSPFGNLGYKYKGFSVLEQSNELKVLTYYANSDYNELNLAVWRVNSSTEGIDMVRESNFTYYATGIWHVDDFATNNKHLLFSQRNSAGDQEGLIVTYENKTWSFNTFFFPYYNYQVSPTKKGNMEKLMWKNNQFYLLFSLPFGLSVFRRKPTQAHICEIVLDGPTSNSSLQKIQRIGECDDSWYSTNNIVIIQGIDENRIILHNYNWRNPKEYLFLYEEEFDTSQVLIYSFGTIGLITLSVLPILIKRLRKKRKE
ncbi:MAG: hypothetical protein KAS63_03825, partial [Candidatus Heimdallarchaeota archaeon]|nr:hypothetical protein [Candidatus Heimdallarchaeota archaeon]MCK4954462.1 hypothetical protein [Candidatus Heimdallarchaeota archaeon]